MKSQIPKRERDIYVLIYFQNGAAARVGRGQSQQLGNPPELPCHGVGGAPVLELSSAAFPGTCGRKSWVSSRAAGLELTF